MAKMTVTLKTPLVTAKGTVVKKEIMNFWIDIPNEKYAVRYKAIDSNDKVLFIQRDVKNSFTSLATDLPKADLISVAQAQNIMEAGVLS